MTKRSTLADLADITRQATPVRRLTVLTLNVHKGFTPRQYPALPVGA